MRKSIATVSLSGSLSEKLGAVAAAGFDGVEIFENDLLASPLSPEEVRKRAADLGLSIDLYQPFRDFEAVPEEVLRSNLRRAEQKFSVMERLGADMMLVCSSVSPASADDDGLAAGQLRRLAQRAEAHGIRLAYEALAWGRHVSTYDHAWRIVELADHPALGTCLDSFHILSRGSDPQGIERIPGEKIFFLQLADAPRMAMDVLQWSRHYRCFPGQGGFDVAGLVEAALRAGYTGPLSLEVFNDVFRQADASRTAVDAMRSLLTLEESAGLASLPAPVIPSSFAFAELAAADTEPLRALLGSLGFTRTGRHGGKPVELWEQGEARLVVNTAGASRREGPALTALGLETPDPGAATRRAESLLAPVIPRRRAAGDVPLEAVEAPDGTELFFCRTGHEDHPSWTDDFTPVPLADAADGADAGPGTGNGPGPGSGSGARAGVTRIDHAALTQSWHRFDEASLFYPSVLGLQPNESLDLADPYGLFRSRALANAEGTLRIALNVAPVPSEREKHPQHIALATDDILATARRVREHGGGLLPIPDNYYDDLRARHGLGDDTLATLRELGILYDRDEYGEFYHCYTATLGRVFFELVQRVDGYRGYGAPNATIRLAAQHTAELGHRPAY
ncbi:sugar phosphate isomerase/epimerase and 4-hydroxyphenylpyruvate domain-containing protein [Streptomyces sp. NBC_01775]|uniref:bifunctional sugar phosphate isomerase/epimerase/4-hydroxyphenylpyruvate dioxygenase family protein n=1 Tax=Streptomyces sp. NBC_01775 TaxID=2975939 RepID=UPI002DD9E69C|nr:TIM barrel protein [Streptomyces sp. NBC_01775]WSB76072.1 sugar phosphate isomerase/epimerase and 4-hydroxyphenylpyruvate domain-containing protein [Streptomyces sp. NBC_01775]